MYSNQLDVYGILFSRYTKYAEVAALFKRFDNLNKENHRPLSVLTALSKVLEKVSGAQLSSYFESIFSNFLSGFRPTLSCQTILLKMIEDWKQSIDNGKMVGTIPVDLSKAFDSLPHGLLIAKLAAYGVYFYSCRLLASYLHNRHQRVKLASRITSVPVKSQRKDRFTTTILDNAIMCAWTGPEYKWLTSA